MKDVVIVSACRTPIGKFQGGLSSFKATQLGSLAIAEAMKRAKLEPELVEEVIFGNVLSAGLGQNPARQAAIGAGIPTSVGAFTVNKVCGSGLKAVMLGAQAIRAGDIDVAVCGGMESMTNAPYLLPQARGGLRLGHGQMLDSMVHDGLWEIYNDFHMGITGELVAEKYDITRGAQDEFASRSHQRATEATAAGRLEDEKFTIEVPQRKADPLAFRTDETIREGMTPESISKMRPAFKKDGTVTAANASAINDGASALVVMSAEKASELGLSPMAKITGYATGGLDPEWVMMAPEVSVTKLSDKLGRKPGDFDLHEINEAFSAAACALVGQLGLDGDKVNVNGGAVALGHPIGASGARILTTLLYAMGQRDAATGMASLCLGGGNAVSLSVERL